MKNLDKAIVIRLFIALFILLSGMALVPFVERPINPLDWRMFAGVYEAQLSVNYPTGRPGSIFIFTGSNYPPNQQATVAINGDNMGTVNTGPAGQFVFDINTTNAPVAVYSISATVNANASATSGFELLNDAPLRGDSGGDTTFYVVYALYLPAVRKP